MMNECRRRVVEGEARLPGGGGLPRACALSAVNRGLPLGPLRFSADSGAEGCPAELRPGLGADVDRGHGHRFETAARYDQFNSASTVRF